MIRYVHLAENLVKQVEVLGKAGRKEKLAVAQYESIVAAIRQSGCYSENVTVKRTKHGELRLKNCVKYDLGSGYRLISVRQGDHLFLPFLGSHDETDRWLERHRNEVFSLKDSSSCHKTFHCREGDLDSSSPASAAEECGAELYEESLQERLDQSLLRSVFCGICRNESSTNTTEEKSHS
ncbi:MAG: hypothetical protein V2I36_08960 [Desulfopila sp.]|jgi:hypothetical protein|nr:hypothetical protein [Desulfopila sp.]